MSGRWDQPGVPHKGWAFIDTTDEGEPTHKCEMCGREQVRYVHRVRHPEHPDLLVGCVCAEKMTDDYVTPRENETKLRNRDARRKNWTSRQWRTSKKGNPWLKVDGVLITVFPQRGAFNYSINWSPQEEVQFGPGGFRTKEEAQYAAFDGFDPPGLR